MSKSNVALFPAPDRASGDRHLGPAEVLHAGARDLEVKLETGRVVRAVPALSTPYRAVPEDVVLAIGDAERTWIIGVISGRGATTLAFDGDVELRSNDGVVRLAGGRGVEIDAPTLEMRAGAVSLVAESVVERVVSFTRRVRDLMSLHAGKKHEVVDGSTTTYAASATMVTKEEVKINGKTIHLG